MTFALAQTPPGDSRALDAGAGFEPCEPFGDSRRTGNNFHMTMYL